MPRSTKAADLDFYALVARAAFSNPFTDGFDELFRRIGGSLSDARSLARARETIVARLQPLENTPRARFDGWTGEERETMRLVFLFDVYQRFYAALDALVAEQIRLGDTPAPVPFARDVLAELHRRGFPRDEALRSLAIFFQIRRAAHFIQHGLVGRSACMKELRRQLWQNVFTHDIRWYERHLWDRMEDFSTMLLGETGTGKGTAAAAVGRSAFIPFEERKGTFAESFMRGFVALNLSQFPETLIESELFGHRKGAFTGAIEAHEGVFARCSPHGAIFLDEIGDASVPAQIKLLQVLQERVFSPVGSRERLRFRGRVIAATNRPLAELRSRGLFRDDFYYRLCSDTITVPPLRQRLREDRRDLPDLLAHLLTRLTGAPSPELVETIAASLSESVGRDYAWPGNVRELEQAVRRILLKHRYEGDERVVAKDRGSAWLRAVEAGSLDADALLGGYCALLYEECGNYQEVARRTGLDVRTVRRYLALRAGASAQPRNPPLA